MTAVLVRRRRKALLEVVSLVPPIAAAVLFSALLVAGWSVDAAVLGAAVAVVVLVAAWLGYRVRRPASTSRWDDDEPSGFEGHTNDAEDDGGTGLGSTLFALAVVGAIAAVAVGTRFVLAWMVVGLFAIAVTDSDLGDVVLAGLGTLAVGLLVELGIVSPLSRRWDLSMDDPVLPTTSSGPSASAT